MQSYQGNCYEPCSIILSMKFVDWVDLLRFHFSFHHSPGIFDSACGIVRAAHRRKRLYRMLGFREGKSTRGAFLL
ncbi:hypothetical protein V6Z11_D12G204300 [Gossypium hirsutum]